MAFTVNRSRLLLRAWSWRAVWGSDRWEQVKEERGPRMEKVKVPTGGVETLGGMVPTTTGENEVFLRAVQGGGPRAVVDGPGEEEGTVQRVGSRGCMMPSYSSRSFWPCGGSERT